MQFLPQLFDNFLHLSNLLMSLFQQTIVRFHSAVFTNLSISFGLVYLHCPLLHILSGYLFFWGIFGWFLLLFIFLSFTRFYSLLHVVITLIAHNVYIIFVLWTIQTSYSSTFITRDLFLLNFLSGERWVHIAFWWDFYLFFLLIWLTLFSPHILITLLPIYLLLQIIL